MNHIAMNTAKNLEFPDLDRVQEMYRKCQLNVSCTFPGQILYTVHVIGSGTFPVVQEISHFHPVVFLHRSCTQYMPYDQSHFPYAGNVTYPVLFLHRSCTQYMPYDQSHFLYAGNVTYPVLFLHRSCTQYAITMTRHMSILQEMPYFL